MTEADLPRAVSHSKTQHMTFSFQEQVLSLWGITSWTRAGS
jgi:hypothetical protein